MGVENEAITAAPVSIPSIEEAKPPEPQQVTAEQPALAPNTGQDTPQTPGRNNLYFLQAGGDLRRAQLNGELPAVSNAALTGPKSQADLEGRAKRIFERFQKDTFSDSRTPYADIAGELNGLTPSEGKRLQSIYKEQFSGQRGGRELLADIVQEVPDLRDRMQAFSILAPEKVHRQLNPSEGRTGRPTIIGDPPLNELVVGTEVKYRFHEGDTLKATGTPPDFVIFAYQGGKTEGAQSGQDFPATYDKAGNYRVYMEVFHPGSKVPDYYTLPQAVREPSVKADEVLNSLPGTATDPELYMQGIDLQIGAVEKKLSDLKGQLAKIPEPGFFEPRNYGREALQKEIGKYEEILTELKQVKETLPAKLFEGAQGRTIPLKAALVPTERPQGIPLQLYAKPLGNNRWAIVDATSPAKARVYEGAAGANNAEGLRNAWGEFINNNNLPKGQIAAEPPAGFGLPSAEKWNAASTGSSSLKNWASGLGWTSLGLAGLGVVAALVPGAEPAAPFLFAAAGATGVGSGALSIADRVKYGDFELKSRETALDMLSIVGGLAGVGGSAALLKGGVGALTIETAQGAKATLTNLGKFVSITQGVDVGAGVGSGILISAQYLKEFERINQLPSPEREKQATALYKQAAAMGGIMVLGVGISRFKGLDAAELNPLLNQAKLKPELEQLVRAEPRLQRALQEQGAERVGKIYDEYLDGIKNGRLKSQTFLDYLSARGVPNSVGKTSTALTDALGVTPAKLGGLSSREINEQVLNLSNPGLMAQYKAGTLPHNIEVAVGEVLAGDFRITAQTSLETARSAISKKLNQRLGELIPGADPNTRTANLRQALAFYEGAANNASRGSVGRAFVEANLLEGRVIREFPFDSASGIARRADELLVNGRRTLDIKTGYADGGMDVSQLRDYNALVKASRNPANAAVRQQLDAAGVRGSLQSHDYLYLPSATGKAEDAAKKALAKIETTLPARDRANVRVLYLGEDGKIYQLVRNRANEVVPRLIGDKLPN